MILDEIMGQYRLGEGLSPDATAELAEGLIQAHRGSINACDVLGLSQRKLSWYFYQIRDASIYAAWRDMPGSESERYEQIARRIRWRKGSGFPADMDELDRAIMFAQANGLNLPESAKRVREIVVQIDCELEDEMTNEFRGEV